MKPDLNVGAVFPQTEIGPDPAAVAEYARTVESIGYDHLVVYDHVLGANAASRPSWSGSYNSDDQFHEVFVLYGSLSAVTEQFGLSIGVGVGWNHIEFEALEQNFADRSERIEEQIGVMRQLWTEDLITHSSHWHTVIDAGLNLLPVQRPIPVWMSGGADLVMDRIGRLADGWFYPGNHPMPDEAAERRKDLMMATAQTDGRDPDPIGIEKVFSHRTPPAGGWSEAVAAWTNYGATHLSLNTTNSGLGSLDDHLATLQDFIDAVRP